MQARNTPAIHNQRQMYLRNVEILGYRLAVNHDPCGRGHGSFVNPAGCHQQQQRLAAEQAAEIAAGPVAPAPGMNGRHCGAELVGEEINRS
jgi:hypothetical protein